MIILYLAMMHGDIPPERLRSSPSSVSQHRRSASGSPAMIAGMFSSYQFAEQFAIVTQ
jgi:hypothetical protein